MGEMNTPKWPVSGPVAHLRQRLGLAGGQVRRITTQNAMGETSVTEVAQDGLSAVRGYPSGVRQWEWVEGDTLCIGDAGGEVSLRQVFDSQGRLVREQEGERVTAEYHYDGPRLSSSSVYEQVSDQDMDWVESTYIPHPPEEGGARREEVTAHYPDGLISVELREFDGQGREIFNEMYSNDDDIFRTSRTTYRDDAHGNWVEMTIRVHSNRPGSERVYVHRRDLEYWV